MIVNIKKKDRFPTLKVELLKTGTTDPHNFNDDGTIYNDGDNNHVFFIMKKTKLSYIGSTILSNSRINQGESTTTPINTEQYNIMLQIDDFDSLLIDVTGDEGETSNYEPSEIIDNINSALSDLDTSLASVASLTTEGKVSIQSPSSSENSKVIIHNNPGQVYKNATEVIFGIEKDTGSDNSEPTYPINPDLFNDKHVNANFISNDPTLGKLEYKWKVRDTYTEGLYLSEFKVKYIEEIILSGEIQFINNSKDIQGSSTYFLSEIKKGDYISADGGSKYYKIEKVNDDESAELSEVFAEATPSTTIDNIDAKTFLFRTFPNTDIQDKKLFVNVIDDIDDDDDFYGN